MAGAAVGSAGVVAGVVVAVDGVVTAVVVRAGGICAVLCTGIADWSATLLVPHAQI